MRILGIESSCDDTGAAIIDSNRNILSNIVISQNRDHSEFLGVVPEIAARLHMSNLKQATEMALKEAALNIKDIDAIAATCGPGLIGGVITGTMFGKAISSVLAKPFVAVNHLEGHALACRLSDDVEYPFLLLLVSGGHCQFVAVKSLGDYTILGSTLDDAVGEAFDKVARMLGLPFPGGPEIEKYAKLGDPNSFDFPRPMYDKKTCDMSFSGLKTAVRLAIQDLLSKYGERLKEQDAQSNERDILSNNQGDQLNEHSPQLREKDVANIAASFQKVVAQILIKKMRFAIDYYEKICNGKRVVVSGGVAANLHIRQELQSLCDDKGYNFVAPPLKLCTDNAAMIAFAGLERLNAGIINSVDFKPRARWSLSDLSISRFERNLDEIRALNE